MDRELKCGQIMQIKAEHRTSDSNKHIKCYKNVNILTRNGCYAEGPFVEIGANKLRLLKL